MKQDDYDNERPQSQMTDAAAAAHARPGACSEYSQAPTHTDDEVSSATADHTGSELVGTTSTSLTSFMEPQSASFSIPDLEVDEDYEDPSDTASMYAPSQYPRAPTAHLRERPYDLATV